MSTTKRRSARLARKSPSPFSPPRSFAAYAVNKLTALLERDDDSAPQAQQQAKRGSGAALSSPVRGRDRMPGGFDSDDSVLKTPQTVPPRPARAEMHPSKAQRSTTEEPDSALRLGFADIKNGGGPSVPALDDTPSKSAAELLQPGFDFKWAGGKGGDAELGSEAQRIMDSVRDEARRIKEHMQAEREEQARKDLEAGLISPVTGRKLAKPRPKGRYSDAHQEQFSRMQSISSHASLLRDKVKTAGQQTLKRTKSRADLADESAVSERPENPRAGKRVRTSVHDDVSTAAAAPRQPVAKTPTGSSSKAVTRPAAALPAAASTPTKSSIARAGAFKTPTKSSLIRTTSIKSIRTASKLPSMIRSKSARTLASPATAVPKSEGSNKYFSALARAPSMKSILHRAQPKYSSDPAKIAAGTHLPMEESTLDLGSPSNPPYPVIGRSPIKRVGFALGDAIKSPQDDPASPPKAPAPEQTPTKSRDAVSYPRLPIARGGPLSSNPPRAGDFTFRPVQPIRFRSAPNTPASKTTIRCVRPSGVSTPLAPFGNMPAVPHGMPNKKRRRADDDEDDEDVENRTPGGHDGGAKRVKVGVTTPKHATPAPRDVRHMDAAEKRKEGVHSASPKKKPLLSLSRLNALARPKNRA